MNPANVINFPTVQPAPRFKVQRSADGFKHFNELQIKLIRRTARDAASLALQRGQSTAVREWMLLDLLTSSGLRASEAANLRVGDVRSAYGESAVFVRNGKGCKCGTVQIPASLRAHLHSYINWKQERGEPTGPDDHLFIGQRGRLTPGGVSQIVKQHLRRLGLYSPGKAAHSLRHSCR
jgi:integrase/recombinase XerD